MATLTAELFWQIDNYTSSEQVSAFCALDAAKRKWAKAGVQFVAAFSPDGDSWFAVRRAVAS